MAFVRRRATKAGLLSAEKLSTSLVESYRDAQGQPRQRTLANLYGEPDTLSALGKLAAQRHRLKKEQAVLAPEIADADEFYETINSKVLMGHKYSAGERKEIDNLMRARKRLHKRFAKIKTDLKQIQKSGAVIKKHCSASAAEIRGAAKKHQAALEHAQQGVMGAEFVVYRMKADLRRLEL